MNRQEYLYPIKANFTNKLAALSSTPQPHPMAPSGQLPSIVESKSSLTSQFVKPIELKEGEVLFRYELPKRFRYTPPSELECEQVDTGGAAFIY